MINHLLGQCRHVIENGGNVLIYNVYVKKIDPIIEEEVTIIINEIELVVFVNVCPYAIEEKKFYLMVLDITILEDLEIKQIDEYKKEFKRIDNNSFSYEIKGLLRDDGVLDAGVLIESELLKGYQYLYGEHIKIKVDRIAGEFI